MKTYIADTSFWIGLCYDNDAYRHDSIKLYENIQDNSKIILPWPSMYETLRTKFVRNYNALKRFEKELKRTNVIKYGDRQIRNSALTELFEMNLRHGRQLSLTDCMIRQIICNGTKLNGLITSNKSDFLEICAPRRVEIYELTTP